MGTFFYVIDGGSGSSHRGEVPQGATPQVPIHVPAPHAPHAPHASQCPPCNCDSSPVAPPHTKPHATPVASSASSGANSAKASYYSPAGGLGSCGKPLQNSDFIVALPPSYMKASCSKCVDVFYNGKSIKVTVEDTCPGCATTGRIDLSIGAWKALESNTGKGLIPVTWSFCGGNLRKDGEEQTPVPNSFPSFAIALIVLGIILVLSVAVMIGVIYSIRRSRNLHETV